MKLLNDSNNREIWIGIQFFLFLFSVENKNIEFLILKYQRYVMYFL